MIMKKGKSNTNPAETITVSVVAYRKAAGLPVELAVSPEVLNLSHLAKCEVVIVWKLETKGYRFPKNGSAIEFTSPGASKVFGKTEVDADGRIATVRSSIADGLAYAYTVSVLDEASGLTAVLDPVVQNRNN